MIRFNRKFFCGTIKLLADTIDGVSDYLWHSKNSTLKVLIRTPKDRRLGGISLFTLHLVRTLQSYVFWTLVIYNENKCKTDKWTNWRESPLWIDVPFDACNQVDTRVYILLSYLKRTVSRNRRCSGLMASLRRSVKRGSLSYQKKGDNGTY